MLTDLKLVNNSDTKTTYACQFKGYGNSWDVEADVPRNYPVAAKVETDDDNASK